MKYNIGDIVYTDERHTNYVMSGDVLLLKIVGIWSEVDYECEILSYDPMFDDKPYVFLESEIVDYWYNIDRNDECCKCEQQDNIQDNVQDKQLIILSVDKVLNTDECLDTAKKIEKHLNDQYQVLVIDNNSYIDII